MGDIMREIVTRVYKFDELEEHGQERAIESVAYLFASDWFDPDAIAEDIVYMLADALQSPGWDTYGSGDFPGINGIKVTEWDVDRLYIEVQGTLTRENAPALPWSKFQSYTFGNRWESARADLADGLEPFHDGTHYAIHDDQDHDYDKLESAIEGALHAAICAGREAYEYTTSEEHVREDIEANEREFHADGTLA